MVFRAGAGGIPVYLGARRGRMGIALPAGSEVPIGRIRLGLTGWSGVFGRGCSAISGIMRRWVPIPHAPTPSTASFLLARQVNERGRERRQRCRRTEKTVFGPVL